MKGQGYVTRPTRSLGVSEAGDWRLKRYEILAGPEPVSEAAQVAAGAVVAAVTDSAEPDVLGVGFVILHRGTEAVWLLVDLWRGDIICQHAFWAPLEDPTAFEPIDSGGPTVCVWEMEVFIHERQAFITHMLNRSEPDSAAYLADQFDNTTPSNRALVERFNTAWAEDDIDALMDVMAAEPVYRASTGQRPGHTYIGRDEVRAGFAAVIAAEAEAGAPPAPPGELHLFDDRALSHWSYQIQSKEGRSVTVEGVDVWTFAGGRITVKDAYRKAFPDPAGDSQ